MSFERLVKNPRKAIKDLDSWVRLQAVSSISRNPISEDRVSFEEMLQDDNPAIALLARKGLTRLFPLASTTKEVWRKLFSETIELLEKRASSTSGASQTRVAALKTLAFVNDLNIAVLENCIKSLYTSFSYESSFISPDSLLPLFNKKEDFLLPESFGLLLASMPTEKEITTKIFKRELECQNPDRIIPALIALQISPNSEMTDQLVWIARNAEKRVADEAAKALLACGGKKVSLVITSLLKETNDSKRKNILLPVIASTDREEVWDVLKGFARGEDINLALTALRAIDGYDSASKREKISLYSEIAKRKEPELIASAAYQAWHLGSSNSIKILKQLLESEKTDYRLAAVKYLAETTPSKAISILFYHFDDEKDESVIKQILFVMRSIFLKINNSRLIENIVLPWLSRYLNSSDAFIRNQIAVLCGYLGSVSEEILLNALSKESHPYVIASLLASLGKVGYDKLLLYTKYHDHNDSRIRANMICSLANCGNEAIPYFYEALNDISPRVRASAAYNLFMLGQLNAVKVLNDMLQIPEPISVLSACYVLTKIFKIVLPTLEANHPVSLAIERKILILQRNKEHGPGLLNSLEAPELFKELASTEGNRSKIINILEEKKKKRPSSILITRLLASMYIANNENDKALPLLESCIKDNPTNLADLLDTYRTVLKLGDLTRANKIGDKTRKLYKMLLDGCIEICRELKGTGSALMLQQLNFLKEPSMNLYNAMIQLKVVEDDTDTVMYLMTELILSRPFNVNLINKLAALMSDDFSQLRQALKLYSSSIITGMNK